MDVNKEATAEEQIASVNVVSSSELTEQAKEGRDLVKLQQEIQDSVDRVEAIKNVLGETTPKDVTTVFGNIVDRQLERVGIRTFGKVGDEEVTGLESLGFGLTPKRYLELRIDACESFLSTWRSWGKKTIQNFFSTVSDQLIMMREGHQSLADRAQKVLDKAKAKDTVFVVGDLDIGRYRSNLDLNGRIPTDLPTQIDRLTSTTRAVTMNFYRANQANANELLSYFGGFLGKNEAEAMERLLMFPQAISKYQFKEAMFSIRELSDAQVVTRGSVELIGNVRFLNTVLLNRSPVSDLAELRKWVDGYCKMERIYLSKVESDKHSDGKMKAFDRKTIESVVKSVQSILRDSEQLYKEGDKYLITGVDYMDMIGQLKDTTWDNALREDVLSLFSDVTINRNNEQIQLRSSVIGYLTIVLNAILSVCEMSME